MESFNELGLRIEAAWRRQDFARAAFPDLACDALARAAPWTAVTFDDVVAWLAESDRLPRQVLAEFGNPVTVFRSHQFYIEVLCWVDGTTDIHEHGFSGAFAVLAGQSIHARYEFEATGGHDRLLFGRVTPGALEHLTRGAVRPIHAGPASAHALFHLDRPSLSVVVRTFHDLGRRPQYNYLVPGLAFDPEYRDEVLTRFEQTLKVVGEVAPDGVAALALRLARRHDSYTAFRVLHRARTLLSLDAYRALLRGVHGSHPTLVEHLEATAEHQWRTDAILAQRRRLHDPHHRFFLATLLHGHTRDAVFALVAAAYPGRPPIATVTAWLDELTRAADPALALDEQALVAMRALLEHDDGDALVRALGAQFEGLTAADVHGLRDQVSAATPLLAPLLRRAPTYPTTPARAGERGYPS